MNIFSTWMELWERSTIRIINKCIFYLDEAVEPITEATGSAENDTDVKKKTGKKQKVRKTKQPWKTSLKL